jgi:hypothetical protein
MIWLDHRATALAAQFDVTAFAALPRNRPSPMRGWSVWLRRLGEQGSRREGDGNDDRRLVTRGVAMSDVIEWWNTYVETLP